MKQDWDTAEQSDMFDEFLADTSDSRSHTWTGAYGYDELEWEAFQYGWNAAKKHYGGCMNERIRQLSDRITAYLFSGGLFNPELANHKAVRDLLMECREVLNERTNSQSR